MNEEEKIEEHSSDNKPQSTENENVSEPSIINDQPSLKKWKTQSP